jgi:hypothetical protein
MNNFLKKLIIVLIFTIIYFFLWEYVSERVVISLGISHILSEVMIKDSE